jgi:hypothetical protein
MFGTLGSFVEQIKLVPEIISPRPSIVVQHWFGILPTLYDRISPLPTYHAEINACLLKHYSNGIVCATYNLCILVFDATLPMVKSPFWSKEIESQD